LRSEDRLIALIQQVSAAARGVGGLPFWWVATVRSCSARSRRCKNRAPVKNIAMKSANRRSYTGLAALAVRDRSARHGSSGRRARVSRPVNIAVS
jgi:hypothetical protein